MRYQPAIAADDINDLKRRLAATRWPAAAPAPGQGIELERVRELANRWQHGYDWDRYRTRLNRFPQVRLEVDGVQQHAIHVPSSEPTAIPLLLAHGWPSTCFEFDLVIEQLSRPVDGLAFHVVCPSLPGYAFSGQPPEAGWDAAHIADAWVSLMAELGYERFLIQGGDWGASVATELALRHPTSLLGLHLTMPLVRVRDEDWASVSTGEAAGRKRERAYRRDGFAYALIQMTRPQTLGYALEDSPVGLLAWIGEKLEAWSDTGADGSSLLDDDALLDVVSTYWLTCSATSSARMYAESLRTDLDRPVTGVPTGCSAFAAEIIRPPRAAVERRYGPLVSWREVDRGGHFPAAEVPDLFLDELRRFALAVPGLVRVE